MNEVRFRPRITASLPKGWQAKESVTLLSPDGRANVIASSEPLDGEITSAEFASAQGELLRMDFPGYEEFEFAPTELFGGKQGFLRRFSWTPPESGPVTQTHPYFADAGRGYTATATTPTTELTRLESQLIDILRSLQIDT